MNDLPEGYRAVANGVGFIDRSDRPRLRIGGPDRAKFLHNLTTNEVKRLPVGEGREAFVTSTQGKTLGYVTLLACDDAILLQTDPGGLEHVLPHLTKYGVFDEVELDDVTSSTFEFHLAGPHVEELVGKVGVQPPAGGELRHTLTRLGSADVRVVRESPTGRPGLTLIGPCEFAEAVAERLRAEGQALAIAEISPSEFEVLRIEAGTPRFGADVTAENLPQEVARDDRAINFVKGCYLGQETVARIDALGHVNKLLVGLRIPEGPPPAPGSPVEAADGKRVGAVTSSAFSPGWGHAIALAYVRTSHNAPGTPLRVGAGDSAVSAVVSTLPMQPLAAG